MLDRMQWMPGQQKHTCTFTLIMEAFCKSNKVQWPEHPACKSSSGGLRRTKETEHCALDTVQKVQILWTVTENRSTRSMYSYKVTIGGVYNRIKWKFINCNEPQNGWTSRIPTELPSHGPSHTISLEMNPKWSQKALSLFVVSWASEMQTFGPK